MVLRIHCSGTPYQIGHDHGRQAKAQIKGCIEFYAGLFLKTAAMPWADVQKTALEFVPTIQAKWPSLLDEMQGMADAAGLELADIVALNVRTEITFGLFSDGCTALSWQTPDAVYLAQNWDWMEEQRDNLVLLHITQTDNLPSIQYLAEAGLVGKIGLNSAGVGVGLNAIRAKGVDRSRLPVHLALRVLLNSTSMTAARQAVEEYGVAASCHILLGDATGAVGLECSHLDIKVLHPVEGRIHHGNHFLLDHTGVVDTNWIPCSNFRTQRIEELADAVPSDKLSMSTIQELFKDEENSPGSICRSQAGDSTVVTLFNIVMDLKEARAEVLMGRPNRPDEVLTLSF
ncbi:hypothetical protein SEUCBS139899_006757 [Sporothrix eucalyptigena]|uniref:Peptidase C45 hydrolase domain-containing protein n=1 Tax=Sporothrix eucalyptigena TaxID=1812306 RepID=A0ABP0CHL8_9PEZI